MTDDQIYQELISMWEVENPGRKLIDGADPLPVPDFSDVFEKTPLTIVDPTEMIVVAPPLEDADTSFLDEVSSTMQMSAQPTHHEKSETGDVCIACSMPWPCANAEQPRGNTLVAVSSHDTWPELPRVTPNS